MSMSSQLTDAQGTDRSALHAQEKVRILTRLLIGASVIGFVLLMYPGWFIAFSLLFLLLGLGCGIAALATMPRAGSGPFDYVLISCLLLAVLLMSLNAGVQLIFINQVNAYSDCLNSALTVSRQQQCRQQFQDDFLGGFLPGQ